MGKQSIGWTIIASSLIAACTIGGTHAAPAHNQDNNPLAKAYGTYAPSGHCQGYPRIGLDASGFTVQSKDGQQRSLHFKMDPIAYRAPVDSILFDFAPAALPKNGLPPVIMTVDAEKHTLVIRNPGQRPMTALQATLVHGSPYARCATATRATTASKTSTLNVYQDAVTPSAAQRAVIERVIASALAMCKQLDPDWRHPSDCYAMAPADLNGDGRADMVIQITPQSRLCGSQGCSGWIVLATANGYARHAIDLPVTHGQIEILPRMHKGMHDLHFVHSKPVWTWTGNKYHVTR